MKKCLFFIVCLILALSSYCFPADSIRETEFWGFYIDDSDTPELWLIAQSGENISFSPAFYIQPISATIGDVPFDFSYTNSDWHTIHAIATVISNDWIEGTYTNETTGVSGTWYGEPFETYDISGKWDIYPDGNESERWTIKQSGAELTLTHDSIQGAGSMIGPYIGFTFTDDEETITASGELVSNNRIEGTYTTNDEHEGTWVGVRVSDDDEFGCFINTII